MQNRKRDTDIQNRLLDSVGEGEGGMFRENSMYIIYSETDHQPSLDAWDKRSALVLWEDLEGAGGEGAGRGDRDGEDMWTQGLFISMYDKIHYKKKKEFQLSYFKS